MTELSLVPVDPASEQLQTWFDAMRLVFKEHAEPSAGFRASRHAAYADHRVTASMDGDRIVGTYRSWDVDLDVPGGVVTADAISSVTVRPTHRRRGVLTSMITADLAAAAERGTAAAVLIASESQIYGRYGFAPATETVTWTVDVRSAALHPAARALTAGVDVDIVSDAEFESAGPVVYAASRRPGDIDRAPMWWSIVSGREPTVESGPHQPSVNVVARGAGGEPEAVLRYSVKEEWPERVILTRLDVGVLHASTPAAEAAIWDFLVNLDIVATIRAADRSTEDVVPSLLTDVRAARQSGRCDFLWTRVLDPAAALSARTYPGPARLVLEVVDPHGWAAGRFALEVDETGSATCERTSAAADVEVPVTVLGATWLGGYDLAAAASAGLVTEHRTGQVARAAQLLRTATPPWSSTWF